MRQPPILKNLLRAVKKSRDFFGKPHRIFYAVFRRSPSTPLPRVVKLKFYCPGNHFPEKLSAVDLPIDFFNFRREKSRNMLKTIINIEHVDSSTCRT